MFLYNRRTGKKIDSAAMTATATDSFSDMLSTTVVLAATLIGHFSGLHIDGFCGLLVGLFILIAGLRSAGEDVYKRQILHKGNPPVSFAVLFLLILMPDANSLHTRRSKRPSQKARYVSCADIGPK